MLSDKARQELVQFVATAKPHLVLTLILEKLVEIQDNQMGILNRLDEIEESLPEVPDHYGVR